MKKIVSLIFFITIFSGSVFAECSDAASEAYDGYRDARKAYRSDDLDSCQSYARKAYKYASYAEDEANSCS